MYNYDPRNTGFRPSRSRFTIPTTTNPYAGVGERDATDVAAPSVAVPAAQSPNSMFNPNARNYGGNFNMSSNMPPSNGYRPPNQQGAGSFVRDTSTPTPETLNPISAANVPLQGAAPSHPMAGGPFQSGVAPAPTADVLARAQGHQAFYDQRNLRNQTREINENYADRTAALQNMGVRYPDKPRVPLSQQRHQLMNAGINPVLEAQKAGISPYQEEAFTKFIEDLFWKQFPDFSGGQPGAAALRDQQLSRLTGNPEG